MTRLIRTGALLTLLGLMLAGCGQKGPLYLPGDEAAAERYGPRDEADSQDKESGDANQKSEGDNQASQATTAAGES